MKKRLERLYRNLNLREFVSPDPLQFLYEYDDPCDREVVGLVASSLAYGRVAQILKSVSNIVSKMDGPRKFVERKSPDEIKKTFMGFKHRFTTGGEMASLLIGAKGAIAKYGSIGACFEANFKKASGDTIGGMSFFVREMRGFAGRDLGYLLPDPSDGSACKRLCLYLRWMVRRDAVDPGGWSGVPASKLIVPLDTHMHAICTRLKFTGRKQADLKAAVEITDSFRKFSPDDPVKYDFALTRLGIRAEMDREAFLSEF